VTRDNGTARPIATSSWVTAIAGRRGIECHLRRAGRARGPSSWP
jgi:hypothetical protein